MAYPDNTVTALLQTDAVTPVTKAVLNERMKWVLEAPLFFDLYYFNLLTMLCDCLLAQDKGHRIYNPAIAIDQRLALGKCDGWRYDKMPPDNIAYQKGLEYTDATAKHLIHKKFDQLNSTEKVQLLIKIQSGDVDKTIWHDVSPVLFFEELLAETTSLFYSHPLALQQIGFVGMADAAGWKNIGLNDNDPLETIEQINLLS